MTAAGETPRGQPKTGGSTGGETEAKKERGIAAEKRGQGEKKESQMEQER